MAMEDKKGDGASSKAGGTPVAKQLANSPARKQLRARVLTGLRLARHSPAKPTFFILCAGNSRCVAYLGPVVGSSQRVQLRSQMVGESGLKFHTGRCVFEAGSYTFVGLTVKGALRPRLERGLLELTGTKYRVRLRTGVVTEEVPAKKDR